MSKKFEQIIVQLIDSMRIVMRSNKTSVEAQLKKAEADKKIVEENIERSKNYLAMLDLNEKLMAEAKEEFSEEKSVKKIKVGK